MTMMTKSLLGLLGGALMASCAYSAEVASPVAAIDDLYRSMDAHDVAGALRYIPAGGFVEISPDFPRPTRITQQDMTALLESPVRVHLGASDMQVTVFDGTAIVTGTRSGGIDRSEPVPDSFSLQFTMVWQKRGDSWLLRHIHLGEGR